MASAARTIVVASTNPVKHAATEQAFKACFSDQTWTVTGADVASGVRDQPLSDVETMQGAMNRVEAAAAAQPDADYWVGLEGGIEILEREMCSFAWAVVRSRDGLVGKARTATFFLPARLMELVVRGEELGVASDKLFGHEDTKRGLGTSGLLTKGVVSRTDLYAQGMMLALAAHQQPDLYKNV